MYPNLMLPVIFDSLGLTLPSSTPLLGPERLQIFFRGNKLPSTGIIVRASFVVTIGSALVCSLGVCSV